MARNSPTRKAGSAAARIPSSHRRFGERLARNGVVFARSRVRPPADLDELLCALDHARDDDNESEPPSESDYRAYLEVVDTSYNEDTMTRAFDSLAKKARRRQQREEEKEEEEEEERGRYVAVYNMMWTEATTPIQRGVSTPKPDVMEALTTAAYPAHALEQLAGALAPTKYPPAMPAFVVHAKGPHGPMDEAEKQYGSVMVHSALQAHSYLSRPMEAFLDKTQALTVAFNGEDLHIYAHHLSADGKYHSYPVSTEKPRFSYAQYKTARRKLRNAQDWGRRRAERTCRRLWAKSREGAAVKRPRARRVRRTGDGHDLGKRRDGREDDADCDAVSEVKGENICDVKRRQEV